MRRTGIAVVVLLAATVASAQDAADAPGPYAGVGVAFAFEQFDLPFRLGADDGSAWSLIGGYRLNSGVALELEGEILPGFDIDGSILGTRVSGEIDGWSLSANVKLFPIPPAENLAPFLLLGVGWLDLDGRVRAFGASFSGDDSDWMLQLGGGVDIAFAPRWILELKASYRFPQDDLDDFEFWTAGANFQYRF